MPNPAILRVLDANLNRAREALRVMEEHARLVLADATLTSDIKTVRHELSRAAPDDLAARLTVMRDIIGDVGTTISTESEFDRRGAGDVARSAAKRLSESLRVIEEYGKTTDTDFARRIEGLRYRAYDLERRLMMHTLARERFGKVRLYVLITESLCHASTQPGGWLTVAEATLRGGADCIQLREPHLDDRELVARGRALAKLCRQHDALFIMNNRPDIAALCGADGVHVGQDDLSVTDARRIVGPDAIVGVSTHDIEQVTSAARLAPDYIAVGPIFASETKPQPCVAGPATLREARAKTSLPIVAIGGINADRATEVLECGADALCVCSAIIAAADPESATAEFRAILAGEKSDPQMNADKRR